MISNEIKGCRMMEKREEICQYKPKRNCNTIDCNNRLCISTSVAAVLAYRLLTESPHYVLCAATDVGMNRLSKVVRPNNIHSLITP